MKRRANARLQVLREASKWRYKQTARKPEKPILMPPAVKVRKPRLRNEGGEVGRGGPLVSVERNAQPLHNMMNRRSHSVLQRSPSNSMLQRSASMPLRREDGAVSVDYLSQHRRNQKLPPQHRLSVGRGVGAGARPSRAKKELRWLEQAHAGAKSSLRGQPRANP